MKKILLNWRAAIIVIAAFEAFGIVYAAIQAANTFAYIFAGFLVLSMLTIVIVTTNELLTKK